MASRYEKWQAWLGKIESAGRKVSLEDYERRDSVLKRSGFLWWERRWLAQHSITSTAMQVMIEDRRAMLARAKYDGKGYWEYYRDIQEMYRANRWFFQNGLASPFELLEWLKKKFHIEDTPERKRRTRRVKDFSAGVAATKEKRGR